jgi:hypothetical protein
LPANGRASFDAELSEVDAALSDAIDEVGDTIEDASDKFSRELRAAFGDTPACLEVHAAIPTASSAKAFGFEDLTVV